MVTEVIMKREVFGSEVAQKSKSEFFSATDLVMAGNKWRVMNNLPLFDINEFMRRKSTIEFVDLLKKKFGDIKIVSKGRGQHTWVHPYLFIDIALAISPELKIEVYGWLFDYLIRYRNESGDSYKKMAGALWNNADNKQAFPRYISTVADKIRSACGVEDWNCATEEQLRKRDKIHEAIFILSDIVKSNDKIVEISIAKAALRKADGGTDR
jgi:hypothetical protein